MEKNEMLHSLPWRLVIGMSLTVRLDPNLPSLSRLDSLSVFSRGPSNSKRTCFYWRVWDWHAYYPRWFLQHKFNVSFAGGQIVINHLEYTVLFTTDLIYADISRKACFGREKYVLLQGIVIIFYINKWCLQKGCSYFFKKNREYKIKGCTLFSP